MMPSVDVMSSVCLWFIFLVLLHWQNTTLNKNVESGILTSILFLGEKIYFPCHETACIDGLNQDKHIPFYFYAWETIELHGYIIYQAVLIICFSSLFFQYGEMDWFDGYISFAF